MFSTINKPAVEISEFNSPLNNNSVQGLFVILLCIFKRRKDKTVPFGQKMCRGELYTPNSPTDYLAGLLRLVRFYKKIDATW